MRSPSLAQHLQSRGRAGLDRIGDAEQPGKLAVDGDKYDGRTVAPQTLGFLSRPCSRDAELGKKALAAKRHLAAVDWP